MHSSEIFYYHFCSFLFMHGRIWGEPGIFPSPRGYTESQNLYRKRAQDFCKSLGFYIEKKLHTTTRTSLRSSKSQGLHNIGRKRFKTTSTSLSQIAEPIQRGKARSFSNSQSLYGGRRGRARNFFSLKGYYRGRP